MKKFLLGVLLSFCFFQPLHYVNASVWIDSSTAGISVYDVVGIDKNFATASSECSGFGGHLPSQSEFVSVYSKKSTDFSGITNLSSDVWTTRSSGAGYHYTESMSSGLGYSLDYSDTSLHRRVCVKTFIPICNSWTYSSWGTCDGTNVNRTISTSSPTGCAGGLPVLSQVCDTCISFSYSSWSVCNGFNRIRTVLTSSPNDCIGGSPVLSMSCATGALTDIEGFGNSLVDDTNSALDLYISFAIGLCILWIGVLIVLRLLRAGKNSVIKK